MIDDHCNSESLFLSSVRRSQHMLRIDFYGPLRVKLAADITKLIAFVAPPLLSCRDINTTLYRLAASSIVIV